MIKQFRAYDEETDRWRYFKIVATTIGWELSGLHFKTGDKSLTDEQSNFDVAYLNLQRLVNDLHLVKLTELSSAEL